MPDCPSVGFETRQKRGSPCSAVQLGSITKQTGDPESHEEEYEGGRSRVDSNADLPDRPLEHSLTVRSRAKPFSRPEDGCAGCQYGGTLSAVVGVEK